MAENADRDGRSRDGIERMLFHGTDSLDTVRGIAINNFDHRLSGKNATVYGEGAYFAKTAKYSHGYTKPPDRFMFLARVLVGEYTLGDRNFKRPPAKPGKAHELYDSCVNDIASPAIFIVFDLKQYYPEFLIQYHSLGDGVVRMRHQPGSHQSNMNVYKGTPASPTAYDASAGATFTAYGQSSSAQSPRLGLSPRHRSPSPTGAMYPSTQISYPGTITSYTKKSRAPSPPRHRSPSPAPIVYPSTQISYPNPRAASPLGLSNTSTRTSADISPSGAQGFQRTNTDVRMQRGKENDKSCVVQ